MFPMTSPIVQLYSNASEILANWPAARLTIRGRDITKLHPPCYKLHLWELPSSYQAGLALGDTAPFKKMNILFEWIFWILKKWIFCLNEYSGF